MTYIVKPKFHHPALPKNALVEIQMVAAAQQ